MTDVKPNSFFPKPKVQSTVLEFIPKKEIYEINDPKNLEKITRVFFSQRRKKLKTPFKILFNNNFNIVNKLDIDLNLRPHNLRHDTYYEITKEYEKL